jgi:hypothetical protein
MAEVGRRRPKGIHVQLIVNPFPAWFITEVMSMMHGLGDVQKPLPESAAIVEELVHQQVCQLGWSKPHLLLE